MNLIIDIGNTFVKYAVFSNNDIIYFLKMTNYQLIEQYSESESESESDIESNRHRRRNIRSRSRSRTNNKKKN